MQFILTCILRSRRVSLISSYRTSQISSSSNIFCTFQRAMAALSDLAHINVKANDPLVLFREWQQEAKTFSTGISSALCLATVSSDGKVSARHLILRRLDDDGFVIMTNKHGQKFEDLNQVPSATMCFLWTYKNDKEESVSRQVRINGSATALETQDCQELYDKEPIFCKIRSHICVQGTKVDWEELKIEHDKLLEKYEKGETDLPMPDNVIGYKLAPSTMEFYHARDHLIADRVFFYKDDKTGDWNHHHLAA